MLLTKAEAIAKFHLKDPHHLNVWPEAIFVSKAELFTTMAPHGQASNAPSAVPAM